MNRSRTISNIKLPAITSLSAFAMVHIILFGPHGESLISKLSRAKQINHNKYYAESKTRTSGYNKLPGDRDPWAPDNIAENQEQKKNTSGSPDGQATDKELRSQLKIIGLSPGHHRV